MNLKKIILDILSRDELKAAVDVAGLEGVDRRSVQSMSDALARSRRVQPETLLTAMTEGQVKVVCERMDMDPKGRKNALIRRLLGDESTPEAVDAPAQDQVDGLSASRPAPDLSPMPAKISVTKTELVWPGKYNEDGTLRETPRVSLPFQVIETVNESRATRAATAPGTQATLFDVYQGNEGDTFEDGWRNKLIWGDNLLVMGSLLEKFAGKVDLIYIDPPFATGADFSFTAEVGDDRESLLKYQSIVEEKAYRDTWGQGLASFALMISDRLALMRDFLCETGSLYVHCDYRVNWLIRCVLDDLFGADNFVNQVSWYYRRWNIAGRMYAANHDTIFVYAKQKGRHTFNQLYIPKSVKSSAQGKSWKSVIGDDGVRRSVLTDEPTKGVPMPDVWEISMINPVGKERVGYPTQKPEALVERVALASSNEGDLICDFFCGSGTTLSVAEKLGRRWIGCDLGRWGIHVTRKRLLGIENCKPFEVLNLGKYERQYWQGTSFAGSGSAQITETALYEYLAFILKLYGARPVPGLTHLHGQKNRAMIHIGAVDAPVTIGEVDAAVDECAKLQQKELHVLGWEWEMGLNDLMANAAKAKGVKLLSLQIPREVMERQAADKGDVRFFELAYLKATVQTPEKLTARVKLEDFVIPNPDLIPNDVRSKVRKWSDYIDYWAVDWDFQNDTFMQGWVTYRTRKDRSLALASDPHTYPKAGKYRALVKVIDIFGNDTSQLFDVRVK